MAKGSSNAVTGEGMPEPAELTPEQQAELDAENAEPKPVDVPAVPDSDDAAPADPDTADASGSSTYDEASAR